MALVSTRRIRTARTFRRTSPRRKLVWATSKGAFAVPNATTPVIDLLAGLETAGTSSTGVTVMRTHLIFNWFPVTIDEAISYGILVATQGQLAAGVGISPATDVGVNWALLTASYPTAAPAAAAPAAAGIQTDRVDLRSKRKVDEMAERYVLSVAHGAAGPISISWF